MIRLSLRATYVDEADRNFERNESTRAAYVVMWLTHIVSSIHRPIDTQHLNIEYCVLEEQRTFFGSQHVLHVRYV